MFINKAFYILISFHTGIMYSMSALGPAIGFLMGAGFLSVYVDPGYKPEGLDESSSGWIGAWWIGFVLCAFLSLIAGIPLMMFPKELPGIPRDTQCKAKIKSSPSRPSNEGFHHNLKGKDFISIFNVSWYIMD